MISRVRGASLVAAFLFLSSAMVLSSQVISFPALNTTDNGAIPASTTGLGSRNTPVSILVYNQFSDLDQEFIHTIDAISRTYGPQFEYTNLTDYTNLATKLPGNDILLITEMETASMVNITAISAVWAGILSTYVQNGGNVIMLDHRSAIMDAAGAHLYNETGLLSFTGIGDYNPSGTLSTAYVANATNALAYGLPSSFSSSNGMISIQTTDGIVVVDDGTDAIVVQNIIGKGNVVYLGFDYYAATTEIDLIFGNAIRLHRHIVFDDSHGQPYELQNELANFGADLNTIMFAVSSISSFDYNYLTACDVIVIPRAAVNYTAAELNFLQGFVESGGAVFVATDYGAFGNHEDAILESFGFMRNKTLPLVDSDDNLGDLGWIPFVGVNLHNHSVTLGVNRVEIYAGTGLIQLPTNSFTLITTDDDGTAAFMGGEDANNTAVAAVSTYGMGRVGILGDCDALDDLTNSDGDGLTNYEENAAFLQNMIRWLSAGGIEEKKVLFDASHNSNYLLTLSYRGLADLWTENGYTIFWMSTFYPSFITGMDILVIEDGLVNYTTDEIDDIDAYVDGGGGLLLLGGAISYGMQADMVGNRFGLDLNNTGYLIDTDDSLVQPDYIVYNASNFGDHPIMRGVHKLESMDASGFISIGGGTALVTTDTDGTSDWDDGSPADGVPVIVAKTYQMGRIVFSGDYRFLRYNADPDVDGIQTLYEQDNSVFILNSLYWLSENRAPSVEVTFPNGGETLNATETITWTAVDFDSDLLHYDVLYSANGGSTWTSLATGLTATTYDWNTTLVADGEQYLVRVVASDGVTTGADVSDAVFAIDNIPETTPGGGGIPLDPTLLAIIAGVAIVAIILIVIVMKKRGSK